MKVNKIRGQKETRSASATISKLLKQSKYQNSRSRSRGWAHPRKKTKRSARNLKPGETS